MQATLQIAAAIIVTLTYRNKLRASGQPWTALYQVVFMIWIRSNVLLN